MSAPDDGGPIADVATLLARLRPERQPGVYVFASLPDGALPPAVSPVATFREREGLSVVVEESQAQAAGLRPLFRASWIVLTVPSDLAAVGLTAAVSAALTAEGISCNVIAAAHHDHLFVPVDQAERALDALHALSARER